MPGLRPSFPDVEITGVGPPGDGGGQSDLFGSTNKPVSSRECMRIFARSARCKVGYGAVVMAGDVANNVTEVTKFLPCDSLILMFRLQFCSVQASLTAQKTDLIIFFILLYTCFGGV